MIKGFKRRLVRWTFDSKYFDGIYELNFKNRIKRDPNFYPIDETLPEDIYVVTFPKSGTTWMQNILAGLYFDINLERTRDTVVQTFIPDIYVNHFYKRFQTPMFFKSHELPQPGYRRTIYIVRDGRDVMISFHHYMKALGNTQSLEDFVKSKAHEWADHLNAWEVNKHQSDILLMRYEDLLSQPGKELRRLCSFIGIERSNEEIEKVIDASSFSKMKKREIEYGWDNIGWTSDEPFLRKGVKGNYEEEFSKELLEWFNGRFERELKKYGYL